MSKAGASQPIPTRPTCQQRVIAELERLNASFRFRRSRAMISGTDNYSPQVKQLALQLKRSRVELLLAGGLEEVQRIYDYVPPLLVPIVLPPRPRSLEAAVRLVAFNLDWYVKPPAPLFRIEWVPNGLTVAALIAFTVQILLAFAGGKIHLDVLLCSILALIVAGSIWHGDPTRAQWIHTLCLHLREVYGIQGPVRASELPGLLPAEPASEPAQGAEDRDHGDRG